MPRGKKKRTNKLFDWKIVIVPLLLILASFGVYSYQQYKNSQIEVTGLVVCGKDGTCEKSLHIHSTLEIEICGKMQSLEKDTGKLSGVHTHKEDNLLHFHERLKVTSSGEVLDWSPLTISKAVEEITGMKLTQECLGTYCNGTRCPNGKKGTLKLEVNGIKQPDIPRYVWKDGDKIRLTFGQD